MSNITFKKTFDNYYSAKDFLGDLMQRKIGHNTLNIAV